MNKFTSTIILLLIIVLSNASLLQSAQYKPLRTSPQLQKYVDAIQQIPEAQELIASIQKEGPITIQSSDTQLAHTFGAYWDPFNRIIHVGSFKNRPEGVIIGTILFELHNALVDSKFDRLDELAFNNKIDRENYIRSMEYLEYVNSHNAAKIAEAGIKKGIFPKNARLPTFRSFDEHFHMQKVSGHSAHFGKNYDMISTRS